MSGMGKGDVSSSYQELAREDIKRGEGDTVGSGVKAWSRL